MRRSMLKYSIMIYVVLGVITISIANTTFMARGMPSGIRCPGRPPPGPPGCLKDVLIFRFVERLCAANSRARGRQRDCDDQASHDCPPLQRQAEIVGPF